MHAASGLFLCIAFFFLLDFFFFFFFFFPFFGPHVGSLVLPPGIKPETLRWKHRVLTAGPPGKSL